MGDWKNVLHSWCENRNEMDCLSSEDTCLNKKPSQSDIEELVRKQRAENSREGLHQQKHANGRLFREWTVVDGKMDGTSREWHENGTLISEEPMKQGVVHGVAKQWSSDGRFLGEYRMEMGTGVVREWNEDGSLLLEMEHLSKSAARGRVYDDLGKALEVYLWNGKPISKTKFYNKLSQHGAL